MNPTRSNSLGIRSAMAAAALGAASVFLPQWDPMDHWAAPDKHVVVVFEQADDDPFDPVGAMIAAVDARLERSAGQ